MELSRSLISSFAAGHLCFSCGRLAQEIGAEQ